jgi:hypothetical protein
VFVRLVSAMSSIQSNRRDGDMDHGPPHSFCA